MKTRTIGRSIALVALTLSLVPLAMPASIAQPPDTPPLEIGEVISKAAPITGTTAVTAKGNVFTITTPQDSVHLHLYIAHSLDASEGLSCGAGGCSAKAYGTAYETIDPNNSATTWQVDCNSNGCTNNPSGGGMEHCSSDCVGMIEVDWDVPLSLTTCAVHYITITAWAYDGNWHSDQAVGEVHLCRGANPGDIVEVSQGPPG